MASIRLQEQLSCIFDVQLGVILHEPEQAVERPEAVFRHHKMMGEQPQRL